MKAQMTVNMVSGVGGISGDMLKYGGEVVVDVMYWCEVFFWNLVTCWVTLKGKNYM